MSIKLYRTTDRIPIKIGDAIFKVSPLTMGQKTELQNSVSKESGVTIQNIDEKTRLLFKYSIKEVEGVEYATGGKFVIKLEDNMLTDDCIDDLYCMEEKSLLSTVLWSFASSIKDKAIGPDGEELKGVEILPPQGGEPVKK